LEHNLLQKGEAFTNTTGTFYESDQGTINGLNFYSSSAAQWVYDSSISGAIIPSGAYVDSTFVNRGESGVNLNFIHGGSYVSGSHSISGAYAQKDLNFYFRHEREAELFIRKSLDAKDSLDKNRGSHDFNINAPCVIISHRNGKNMPFSFGGQDETETNYQAVIISDDAYKLDGALSIFEDLNETCFPVVNFSDIPWNVYGDVKSGEFNYTGLYLQYPENSQRATIDRVITNTIAPDEQNRTNFYMGYAEFRILNYRYPRAGGPNYVQFEGDYVVYP
jgi:hypothetical protein